MAKKRINEILISFGISVVILFLFSAGIFKNLEYRVLDLRFKVREVQAPKSPIVIIAIDEASLEKIGRWPWKRSVHANLITLLSKAKAKVVGFDISFSEPDKFNPLEDKFLVEAVKKAGNIVSTMELEMKRGELHKTLPPFYELKENSLDIGHVSIFPESDGVSRNITLAIQDKGVTHYNFSLAMAAQYLNKSKKEVLNTVLLNKYNEMLVNFRGGYKTFLYFSYADVLSGNAPLENFKDKIVLVGATGSGLFDFRAVPVSPVFPGVEIHANAIDNILTGDYLVPFSYWGNVFLILITGFIIGAIIPRISPWKNTWLVFFIFIVCFLFEQRVFLKYNLWINFIAPGLVLWIGFVAVVFYRFIVEEKEKWKIKHIFQHYVSKQEMDEMLNNPAELYLGGVRRNLTVLFSDIRGFTSLSESLPSEEVVEMLNEYFNVMTRSIFKYEGTIDKFIGDAIMVIYGAPVKQDDHSFRAVCTALDMLSELKKLQQKWQAEGKKSIDIGIGINTGEMIVGNIGAENLWNYTVVGDNVNIASRIQNINKQFNTHIIIGEETYNQVKDKTEVRMIGDVPVKGRTGEIKIFELVGLKK